MPSLVSFYRSIIKWMTISIPFRYVNHHQVERTPSVQPYFDLLGFLTWLNAQKLIKLIRIVEEDPLNRIPYLTISERMLKNPKQQPPLAPSS